MDNMIGTRIKEMRKKNKLTLVQMQEKTGISNGNLSEIERGIKLPALPSFIKLIQVLNCSADFLLFGENFSPHTEDTICISSDEKLLLDLYRQLNNDDQEELLEFIRMKLRLKNQKEKLLDSSLENNSASA